MQDQKSTTAMMGTSTGDHPGKKNRKDDGPKKIWIVLQETVHLIIIIIIFITIIIIIQLPQCHLQSFKGIGKSQFSSINTIKKCI